VTAISELGTLLSADEASRVAAELRQRKLAHLAAKRAYPEHRSAVRDLLQDLIGSQGDVLRAAAVLDGIAAVPRVERPDLVWTSPQVAGAEGRTTLAALDLINNAQKSVYAATYSAGKGSPHLVALANACLRGVSVTVVVDTRKMSEHAAVIREALPDARMWTLAEPDNGAWAIQHAKVIAVDDRTSLISSANFSEAAALRSLECGVYSTEPTVSRGVREQLERLREAKVLVDY